MNPCPGTSWPDLHYVETEQVQLDVAAIIARGTRLRRKRLIGKVTAVAVVAAIAPTAVVMDMHPPVPSTLIAGPAQVYGPRQPYQPYQPSNGHGVMNVPDHVRAAGPAGQVQPPRATAKQVSNPVAGDFNDNLTNAPPQAPVLLASTLSSRYGSMLAIAGARAGSGVWFAATAAQLTIFRLSVTGAMRSWSLPVPASSVRPGTNVGLAVTATGVAWLGVASTLFRLDTKTAQVSSWPIPVTALSSTVTTTAARSVRFAAAQPGSAHPLGGDSLAVSPDGHVAVVLPRSTSVQVLNPRNGTFRQIHLLQPTDQPLAVGYAGNGTLGIAFTQLGQRPAGGVLLVTQSGAELTVPVLQPTAVAAYGRSDLLVGVTKLQVVSAQGATRPLLLPADTDFAGVLTQPAPLPGKRLGIALDTAILTFPATAESVQVATAQSQLWLAPQPPCRSRRDCPAGYQLMTTDAAGDMWVVPAADQHVVDLVSLG